MVITTELSELEQSILANEVLDMEHWVREAVKGKVAACKSRMLSEAQTALLEDPNTTSIPATEEGVIEAYVNLETYKTFAERNAEQDETLTENF